MFDSSLLEITNSLLENRNRAVGNLLLSECAPEYLSILVALRRLREEHELEPLSEDLAENVGATDMDRFNQNIRQLLDWGLITQRIERERLRGYKDTRRRKFRYQITDDALAFVIWLETRRQMDLEPVDDDTRDLLSDLSATLKDAIKVMNKISVDSVDEDSARTLFHKINRISAITADVSRSLSDFNIRLLAFVTGSYQIETARLLITELDHFLKRFLRRITTLRQEISPDLSKLRATRYESRWAACQKILNQESHSVRLLFRTRAIDPLKTLASVQEFYKKDGTLEKLTARVNSSALLVWRKLHAHLRELERKSHRIEDLTARISEMAKLPEDAVPYEWFRHVLQSARMVGDPNEWTESQKARPPLPVWARPHVNRDPLVWLEPRRAGTGKPVQSLDEYKLELLQKWIHEHGIDPTENATPHKISEGHYETYDDFSRLFELARSGILGKGARLAKIGLHADILPERVTLGNDKCSLEMNDLSLKGNGSNGNPS